MKKFALTGFLLVASLGWLAVGADSIQSQLDASRGRLVELRKTCKDSHPLVQAEQKKIAELELRAKLGEGPEAELQIAKLKLAELRKTCKEKHPEVQAQLQKISELEKAVRKPAQ